MTDRSTGSVPLNRGDPGSQADRPDPATIPMFGRAVSMTGVLLSRERFTLFRNGGHRNHASQQKVQDLLSGKLIGERVSARQIRIAVNCRVLVW